MMTEVGPCKQAQFSCPLLLLQDFVSIINKVASPNLAVQCNELFHLLFVQQYFFLTNTFSCYLQIPPAPFGTELLEQVGVTKVYHYKSDRCEVASRFSQISSSVRQLGTNIPWLNGTYSLLFMFKFNSLHVCFGFSGLRYLAVALVLHIDLIFLLMTSTYICLSGHEISVGFCFAW